MTTNGHCPFCDSTDIYKISKLLWRCNDCDRTFQNPVPDAAVPPAPEAVGESAADAAPADNPPST